MTEHLGAKSNGLPVTSAFGGVAPVAGPATVVAAGVALSAWWPEIAVAISNRAVPASKGLGRSEYRVDAAGAGLVEAEGCATGRRSDGVWSVSATTQHPSDHLTNSNSPASSELPGPHLHRYQAPRCPPIATGSPHAATGTTDLARPGSQATVDRGHIGSRTRVRGEFFLRRRLCSRRALLPGPPPL